MSAAVTRVLGSRVLNNALKHKPTTRAGVMVNGGGYQGKTETVCEVAAAFEDQWLACTSTSTRTPWPALGTCWPPSPTCRPR